MKRTIEGLAKLAAHKQEMADDAIRDSHILRAEGRAYAHASRLLQEDLARELRESNAVGGYPSDSVKGNEVGNGEKCGSGGRDLDGPSRPRYSV